MSRMVFGYHNVGGAHYELQSTFLAYFLCWLLTGFFWRFKSSGGHCILRMRQQAAAVLWRTEIESKA